MHLDSGTDPWDSIAEILRERADWAERAVRSVPLHDSAGTACGYLDSLNSADLDERSVAILAAWRDAAQYAYPSRFEVTNEGTRRWLEALLQDRDRILFWVRTTDGDAVGHIGLRRVGDAGVVEIDNVLRGAPESPGIMGRALRVCVDMVFHEFGRRSVELRVLQSNDRALNFYERFGFEVVETEPLVEQATQSGTSLVPASPGDTPNDFFVRMRFVDSQLPSQPGLVLTAGPRITSAERTNVFRAVNTAWNQNAGRYVAALEDRFCQLLGRRHAIATSSGTGALHLSLAGIGVGPGDEVIVPNITWVATASAVAYVGATPVFADVDPVSWTLDAASVVALISDRTRAVLPVHLYGYVADVQKLKRSLPPHIAIVEDAAPAIGASAGGCLAGTLGDVAAFSFQGAKLVVGGEGGIVVTDNDEVAAEIRSLANHGRVAGGFEIARLGFKYKMNDVTAALVMGQLDHLEQMIQRKRWLNESYERRIASIADLEMQRSQAGHRSIHWMNSVCLTADRQNRADVIKSLLAAQIDTRPVFPLLSSFPIWSSNGATPVASRIASGGINLPSGVNLTDATVARVCEALEIAVDASRQVR